MAQKKPLTCRSEGKRKVPTIGSGRSHYKSIEFYEDLHSKGKFVRRNRDENFVQLIS